MALRDDCSPDAVVVVPGLMGSELRDNSTGRVVWGIADAGWYARAWATPSGMADLALDPDEAEGRARRLTATRLLRFPAFLPVLRGVEPYTNLLAGLRCCVRDDSAISEFPYDWRLSPAHNGRLLEDHASRHLDRWRHSTTGSATAGLTIVAHSMGGLVADQFLHCARPGLDLTRLITIGTPFHGSVRALEVIGHGTGAPFPLPRARLRELAAGLPGLYALLPRYRCVLEGGGSRVLTTSDVRSIGGDPDLADAVLAARPSDPDARAAMYEIVGVDQPTPQSASIVDGSVTVHHHVLEQDPVSGAVVEVDRRGDSTVYRDAAARPHGVPTHVPQTHSAIARSPETIAQIRAIMTQRPLGPPLGVGTAGVDVPDVVEVGRPFAVTVDGRGSSPLLRCRVESASHQRTVARPSLTAGETEARATLTLPEEGVFRIVIHGTGLVGEISQLVLCVREP